MMANRKTCYSHGYQPYTLVENKSVKGNTSVRGLTSIEELQTTLNEVTENLKQKEKEIDNLKKCKAELSDNVVCLRQEIYALREYKLKIEKQDKETKSKLLMISERNAALVQEKANLNLENQKLKMEILALSKDKYNNSPINQLDLSFHTYPWLLHVDKSIPPFMSSPTRPINSVSLEKFYNNSNESRTESWEEISQKLFAQMKLEMNELEELGRKLAIENPLENEKICEECSVTNVRSLPKYDSLGDANITNDEIYETENIISDLKQQLQYIKKSALEHNTYVRKMLQKVLHFTKSNNSPLSLNTSQRSIGRVTEVNDYIDSDLSNTDKFQFPRPSDESFRAYFTQQLQNSSQLVSHNVHNRNSLDEKNMTNIPEENCSVTPENHTKQFEKKMTNFFEISDLKNNIPKENHLECNTAVKMPYSVTPVVPPNSDDDRICPMCEAVFPKTISQNDFETHVVSHFEVEPNSILENFEVI